MGIDNKKLDIYQIVKTGKISVPGVSDGKPIPVIVVNQLKSPKLNELIKIHQKLPPGDIEIVWGLPLSLFAPKFIVLTFNFSKHMEFSFRLKFNIKEQFNLVDEIFQSKAIYLKSGILGEKISKSIKMGILVEVPLTDTYKKWERILFNTIKDIYKKDKLKKTELNKLTKEHIKKMRQKWDFKRN